MARSTYVYAVFAEYFSSWPRRPALELVALFTVKHEMVKWLGHRPNLSRVEVRRYHDGIAYDDNPGDYVEMKGLAR